MTNDYYLNSVWKKTLDIIKQSEKVSEIVFDNFYLKSRLHSLNDNKAIVVVANFVDKSILNGELLLIETSLEKALESGNRIPIDICTESDIRDLSVQDTMELPRLDIFDGLPLREDRTFENFVVGQSNKESHSAALATAINPGKYFNPLFIYANSGLGKTHLLQAIGNYIKKNDPTKVVYYTDTNKFVDIVREASNQKKLDAFKKYMCSVDVLLIDDIQFLSNKDKSQEIFFTIYNELVNNRKQICIVSDRMPTEIKDIEDRLISRFTSGLSVSIDSPEFETSLKILKLKMKSSHAMDIDIDDDALAFIASNFNHDVRQLEGALNRVIFYAIEFQPGGEKISLESTVNALKNQATSADKSTISPKKIIKCVSDYYGLTKQQLISKSRTKQISLARQISMYLCRKLLDMPYIKIGEEFGNRDHSTVISSCDKVEKQIKENTALSQAIMEIEKIINY